MPEIWGKDRLGFIENARPICGKDFCDICGDCLYCYDDTEYCWHMWTVYLDDLAEFMLTHEGATLDWDE